MTLKLNQKWSDYLYHKPETGMGYQIATVMLKDGRRFERVVVDGNVEISEIFGHTNIPFTDEDIADIIVTHDKWDFETGREMGELPHP